jgi:hypothetical protein
VETDKWKKFDVIAKAARNQMELETSEKYMYDIEMYKENAGLKIISKKRGKNKSIFVIVLQCKSDFFC